MIIDEKSDIKTLVVPCSKCGYAQSGTVHGSFDVSDKEVYDHAGRLFFLVQCPGCKSPFLLYVDWGYVGEEGFATDKPAVLYPDPGTSFDASVPAVVAESFAATIKTAQAGVPQATAMMCRRTLETVCVQLGATKWGLKDKLKELGDTNRLDPRLLEWSRAVLKELGDDAAHIKANITAADAQDAIEFTRALINYAFVLEHAYQTFKFRRQISEPL